MINQQHVDMGINWPSSLTHQVLHRLVALAPLLRGTGLGDLGRAGAGAAAAAAVRAGRRRLAGAAARGGGRLLLLLGLLHLRPLARLGWVLLLAPLRLLGLGRRALLAQGGLHRAALAALARALGLLLLLPL